MVFKRTATYRPLVLTTCYRSHINVTLAGPCTITQLK